MGEGRTKQWETGTLVFLFFCGRDLWKGEGGGGVHGVNKMDTTGTFGSFHHRDFQEGMQGI